LLASCQLVPAATRRAVLRSGVPPMLLQRRLAQRNARVEHAARLVELQDGAPARSAPRSRRHRRRQGSNTAVRSPPQSTPEAEEQQQQQQSPSGVVATVRPTRWQFGSVPPRRSVWLTSISVGVRRCARLSRRQGRNQQATTCPGSAARRSRRGRSRRGRRRSNR
jgi:hypothetical protein